AAAKWESIIVGDLPNATYNGVSVDDLLIDASGAPIDGTGNILGVMGRVKTRHRGARQNRQVNGCGLTLMSSGEPVGAFGWVFMVQLSSGGDLDLVSACPRRR